MIKNRIEQAMLFDNAKVMYFTQRELYFYEPTENEPGFPV